MNKSYRIYLFIAVFTLAPWLANWFALYFQSNMWCSFFYYHWLVLLPIAIWKRSLWFSHLSMITAKPACFVVLSSIFALVVAQAVFLNFGSLIIDTESIYSKLVQLRFDLAFLVPLSFYFVVVNPFLEEIFWRGTIQNCLLEWISSKDKLAILIASIAFGSWHYLVLRLLLNPGYAEAFTIAIVLSGYLLGLIYRKYKSLTIPIMVHALVLDLPLILVLWQIVPVFK